MHNKTHLNSTTVLFDNQMSHTGVAWSVKGEPDASNSDQWVGAFGSIGPIPMKLKI